MHTMMNTADSEQIFTRIHALQMDDRALWGRMTVNEALCHVTDVFRMAFGTIKTPDHSNAFTRQVLKRLALLGLPSPRGKVPTSPQLDQSQGKGTRPTTLEQDKKLFQEQMAEFLRKDATFTFQSHPIFGALTKTEWGRLLFLHTNHHLTQFGR